MIIVGLTGKAGSGKDTVADRLVARHGFQKMAFAEPLKRVLRTVDPYIGFDPMSPSQILTVTQALEKCGGEEGVKKLFPAYRRYLQKLGTEGIRSIDAEFWVKAAMLELDKLPENARVVFTDCRFPNEANALHAYTGKDWRTATSEVWQVERQDELRGNGDVAPHASEEHVGRMGEQITVYNNSTLEDLYWCVDSLARDLIEVESVKLAA